MDRPENRKVRRNPRGFREESDFQDGLDESLEDSGPRTAGEAKTVLFAIMTCRACWLEMKRGITGRASRGWSEHSCDAAIDAVMNEDPARADYRAEGE